MAHIHVETGRSHATLLQGSSKDAKVQPLKHTVLSNATNYVSTGKTNSAPLANSVSNNAEFETVIVRHASTCNIGNSSDREPLGLNHILLGSPSLVSPPTETTASPMSLALQYDFSPRPHSPPYSSTNYAPHYGTTLGRSVRETVTLNRTYQPRNSTNNVQLLMEERLTRWRPTDSHQSVDATMNGQHPYQLGAFQARGTTTSSITGLHFFVSLKEWWEQKHESTAINLPRVDPDPSTVQEIGGWTTYNFSNLLRKIQPHSSDSFIVERGTPQHFINGECQSSRQTPEAIPYSNFELNFSKRNDTSSNSIGRTQHIELEDNETMNLIEVNENFLTSIMGATWACISSLSC